jgi:serine/threonine protein kinase
VAVKILRKTPQEDPAYWEIRKQGLLREGQRLREAEHDNIVRVYQVLESPRDDSIWLVMEFCEHGSLQPYYERGPMSLHMLRSVLGDTALGLNAIHARGLIHRDIKPANILLGANNRAKLADFGLVTGEFVFGYAAAVGYSDHLAREAHELGITSVRTDMWAFGMTTYRLLHGQQFYMEQPRPRDLIPEGDFAKKLSWLPHIPDAWRRFVRQLMHDDPDRRVQSAMEVLRCLARLPVEPDWHCTYSGDRVQWSRTTNERRIEVIWVQHSPRRHEWEARSFPLGVGRERRLAGSEGIVNHATAITGLEIFFEEGH